MRYIQKPPFGKGGFPCASGLAAPVATTIVHRGRYGSPYPADIASRVDETVDQRVEEVFTSVVADVGLGRVPVVETDLRDFVLRKHFPFQSPGEVLFDVNMVGVRLDGAVIREPGAFDEFLEEDFPYFFAGYDAVFRCGSEKDRIENVFRVVVGFFLERRRLRIQLGFFRHSQDVVFENFCVPPTFGDARMRRG